MVRRIYILLLLTSLVVGILMVIFRNELSNNLLVGSLFVLSMVMVASIHGIIAHVLNPRLKGGLVLYPVAMGFLFYLLFFSCVYVLLPLICNGN